MDDKNKIKLTRTYISLITLGESTVGKTCLTQCFIGKEFKEMNLTTIGQEFFFTTIEKNEHKIKIKIWDTAGQERYRSIALSSIRNSNGVLLVYDITNKTSYNTLEYWFKQITNTIAVSDTPIVLVGNKVDLENEREIPCDKGEEFAKKHGIRFFECSAKSGKNVQEAFNCLIDEFYSKHKNEFDFADGDNKNVVLGKEEGSNKKKKKKRDLC
jgi:small GTP-binding protein